MIHRANPALGDTDKVLKILAAQNRQLAQLATRLGHGAGAAREGARRDRRLRHARRTRPRRRRAARANDGSRIVPAVPVVPAPAAAADGRPRRARRAGDAGDDASSARAPPALGRQFANADAVRDRGAHGADRARQAAAQQSQPPLVATLPLAQQLRRLGDQRPGRRAVSSTSCSRASTRPAAIEQLMSCCSTARRASTASTAPATTCASEPLVSGCTGVLRRRRSPGCSANFDAPARARRAAMPSRAHGAAQARRTRRSSSAGPAPAAAHRTIVAQALVAGGQRARDRARRAVGAEACSPT